MHYRACYDVEFDSAFKQMFALHMTPVLLVHMYVHVISQGCVNIQELLVRLVG